MSTSDSCKDGASKLCEVNNKLQSMSTEGKDYDVSICANCGKEGDDINNICNKCKQVKYCNAACKKKHRHKHKKECDEHFRLASEKHKEELKRAAKLHDIELFKQPPPEEDCPICFIRLPILNTGRRYKSCCGKTICSGCIHAPLYDNQGNEVANDKCPFCRVPTPSSNNEIIERVQKRMENDDAKAIYSIGNWYKDGKYGFVQDYTKALELYHRAAELGDAVAYCNIGYAYKSGEGVKRDMKKAEHYTELAAMAGNDIARFNLGIMEEHEGSLDRSIKHHMIAVKDGCTDSLIMIKQMYSKGDASKDDYTKALQCYQVYLGEIKSDQRDKAAAFNARNRYY